MMKVLIFFSLFSLCFANPMEDLTDPMVDYLRNYYMPFAAAAYSDNPNKCLSNIQKWIDKYHDISSGNHPNETISLYRQYKIKCPSLHDYCSGYTAILNANKNGSNAPIVVAFKGTANFENFFQNVWNHNEMVPFVGGGKVSKQFLDAFNNIWINAGMKDDVLTLRNKYPLSIFIFVGHSTGGAMASLAASTVTSTGLTEFVGLFTFGQPRTGDAKYASADRLGPSWWSSDRVVHNADIVSHLPSLNDSTYYHHISEWWWPNDMAVGANYTQCSSVNGEDPKCSNSLDDSKLNFDDHKMYFGRNVTDYGINGCTDLSNGKHPKAYNFKAMPKSSLFISPLGTIFTKEAKNELFN
uniref:Fungal lipase-like domain-containing protein n=1 Tax=Panagrolaimus davidi TaxID=227884 RepID=A0A914P8R0_9BILA